MRTILFETQTANGSSDAVTAESSRGTFITYGTWDTATMTIELSADGTTWIPVTSGAFTANGYITVDLSPGVQYRYTLSSVGASTSLDADLFFNRGV
jgi:hypothetical protein